MTKICSLLVTAACLFSVSIFANDTIAVAEKNNVAVFDAIGPVITYTPVIKSSCLTIKSFSAAITDIDGVNTTLGTRPRVYYRRSTDANVWNSNTNATAGWKYAEATNTTSPYNFNINYSLLSGGTGILVGQTIEYFVVAQDQVATPNISINSGNFAIAPASVNLTAAAFPIGGAINSYNIVNDLGNYLQVGFFGDFTNLTTAGGLFNVINNVGLSANTTVEIIDPLLTENNAHPLNQLQNTGCNAGTVSLIIKPASGVTATVTGSVPSNPLIRILSSNVTIDGSNNGTTSRNLTLQNTNATDPVVLLYGSTGTVQITNSTLKNTICNNGANSTANVVISDGAVAGGGGYFNNITIQNNSIQKGYIGVLCAAVSSAGNGSMLITGNDLNSTASNQLGLIGIYASGLDGAIISNNNIGNFASASASPTGIFITFNVVNTILSGNTISNISYTSAGPSSATGILVTTAMAASNLNISGNTISNISSSGTNLANGIQIASPTGGITIQKNTINNIKNTHAAGYGAHGINLISTLTASNITVADNFIYDIAGAGSATLPNIRNGYGIYMGNGGGYKIYYNSIAMNTNQVNASGITAALMINGVNAAAALDIRNNIFANTQTSGAPAASRYAIYSANANTVFSNIDYNDYYSNGTNLGFLTSNRITLADIQAGFGSNANSLNVLPNFVSSTNLHLVAGSNCSLVGSAIPLSAINDDIDNQLRDPVSPDIGADEFSGTMAAPFVCQTSIVAATGTTFIDAGCNRIARVLPSGADPVGGSIRACVTYDATQQFFNGEPYVQRHYDLEPAVSNQTTTSATVTLYFTDADFVTYNSLNPVWPPLPTATLGNSDPNRANVKVTQFHGLPFGGLPTTTPGNYSGSRVLITPGAANVYWNGAYWAVTFNVSGFSGFYVHTNFTNTPLPVVINYFTGQKQGINHVLNWKVNCHGTPGVSMMLERSGDSRNFVSIHRITPNAVQCNQPFVYTDSDPLKGINYYRLKITDADGKVSYSSTVALLNAVKGFDIVSMAPNPVVTNNFKLNIASAQAGKMDIRIFDMQGRLVNRQSISLIAGFNSLPVQVDQLSAGTYTIRGIMAGEQSGIMRFVKQ